MCESCSRLLAENHRLRKQMRDLMQFVEQVVGIPIREQRQQVGGLEWLSAIGASDDQVKDPSVSTESAHSKARLIPLGLLPDTAATYPRQPAAPVAPGQPPPSRARRKSMTKPRHSNIPRGVFAIQETIADSDSSLDCCNDRKCGCLGTSCGNSSLSCGGALGPIAFPAQLRLQSRCSSPEAELFKRTLGLSAGDNPLVLPIDLQTQVRRTAQECALNSVPVTDGAQVTLWVFGPSSNEGPRLLEPLVAHRFAQAGVTTQCFALQPTVLQVERRSAAAGPYASKGSTLLYGESFGLRCRRSNSYVCHTGPDEPLLWTAPKDGTEPPPGSRFALHGGELGTPVSLGRKVLFARVTSPAPSPSWPDSEDEDDESEHTHSTVQCDTGSEIQTVALGVSTKSAEPASQLFKPGEFMSSLADDSNFEAAFLPAIGAASAWGI